MSEHAEFDCVIVQMRSLESLLTGAQANEPIGAQQLLPVCEAVRMLATKLAQLMPTAPADELAEPVAALHH